MDAVNWASLACLASGLLLIFKSLSCRCLLSILRIHINKKASGVNINIPTYFFSKPSWKRWVSVSWPLGQLTVGIAAQVGEEMFFRPQLCPFDCASGTFSFPGDGVRTCWKSYSGWWFGCHFLFSHILGIIIPIDFHIFQRGSNHQPEMIRWITQLTLDIFGGLRADSPRLKLVITWAICIHSSARSYVCEVVKLVKWWGGGSIVPIKNVDPKKTIRIEFWIPIDVVSTYHRNGWLKQIPMFNGWPKFDVFCHNGDGKLYGKSFMFLIHDDHWWSMIIPSNRVESPVQVSFSW